MQLTVDTKVLRDYDSPWRPGHSLACRLLDEFHDSGTCDIAITTRVDADVPDEPLRSRLMSLGIDKLSTIGTVFRLDVSRLGGAGGGGDMLASQEWVDTERELRELIFPEFPLIGRKAPQRTADIDHLMGHWIAKRDYFVTNDKPILAPKDQLSSRFGIAVVSLGEIVAILDEL